MFPRNEDLPVIWLQEINATVTGFRSAVKIGNFKLLPRMLQAYTAVGSDVSGGKMNLQKIKNCFFEENGTRYERVFFAMINSEPYKQASAFQESWDKILKNHVDKANVEIRVNISSQSGSNYNFPGLIQLESHVSV